MLYYIPNIAVKLMRKKENEGKIASVVKWNKCNLCKQERKLQEKYTFEI